ncbi:MAG: CoA pyrophosphatase [Granulosicoccus sp.]|nr:CoA pyrophosphatase [Granulosicoccus sp.]
MTDSPFSKLPENLYRDSDLPQETGPSGRDEANNQPRRLASVLLPLHQIENEWQLLFIRRAEHKHDRHSGQVAFPGGAQEPADSNQIDTALRETEEEIGVSRKHIDVIATLPVYITSSNFHVTPVVGIVNWPVEIRPAPDEVARVFSIPLNWLINQDNFELRARTGTDSTRNNYHPVVYFERYDGELLWGASARMTLNFIRALNEGTIQLPKG